jgi:ribonuclease HI
MVKELGGASPSTTNNQMELLGVIEGLEWLSLKGSKEVMIWTASTYVIKGITSWVFGWRQKGWMTANGSPVLNQSHWERLLHVVGKFPKGSLSWNYVPGHAGIEGNERCDEIAVQYSKGQHPFLYEGPYEGYSVSLDVPEDSLKNSVQKKSKSSSAKAISYLSLIGGVALRHSSWASCERRVKGRPGAKFKKITKDLSENDILKSWGINSLNVKDSDD